MSLFTDNYLFAHLYLALEYAIAVHTGEEVTDRYTYEALTSDDQHGKCCKVCTSCIQSCLRGHLSGYDTSGYGSRCTECPLTSEEPAAYGEGAEGQAHKADQCYYYGLPLSHELLYMDHGTHAHEDQHDGKVAGDGGDACIIYG